MNELMDVVKTGISKINPIKTFTAIGVVAMMGFLCYALIKFEIPSNNKDAVMMLIGIISTVVVSIISYYFGSSAGSKNKDDIIKQMNQK